MISRHGRFAGAMAAALVFAAAGASAAGASNAGACQTAQSANPVPVHVRAPAEVARALGLKTGDAAVQVRRLLSFGDRPVVLDDIWLPGPLFKGLSADKLAAWRGPMYRLFESEFGVRMIRAEEKLRAVAAGAAEAALLNVPEGAPLLSVERRALTYGDRPVELRRGLYETSAHFYRNELS